MNYFNKNKKVLLSILTAIFLFCGINFVSAQDIWTTSDPTYSSGNSTFYDPNAYWTTSNPSYSNNTSNSGAVWTTSDPVYSVVPSTNLPVDTYSVIPSINQPVDTYSVVPTTNSYPADTYSVVPVTYTTTNTTGNVSTPSIGYTGAPNYTGGYTGGFNYGSAPFNFSLGFGNNGYTNFGYTSPFGYTGFVTPNATCGIGQVLINGVCQTSTVCGVGTTLINGVCQTTATCGIGQTLVNGVCTNTTVCGAGTTLINGVCQTLCPSGYLLNGVCQGVTYTNPGYTNYTQYQTCADGTVVPLGSYCSSQYKTCLNGSVIPSSQICYTVCPNGQSVPEYSSCPYINNPTVYTPPVKVDFNNVVTSITTQITKNSARCNGIGLIANGASSIGWFEYGETSNLGRDTSKVSIGSTYTAPFSNVLTNLKNNTTYYCRAVMSNQYGVVKGEIVKWTTGDKSVSYVAPRTKTATKKKTTNEITCSDGTILKTSPTQASIINNGDKLVTAVLEKVNGEISPNGEVNYRFNYKNISDGRLDNVIIKIIVPQEFSFVNSNVGSYDDNTHTLTFNQNTMDALNEGVVSFKVRVSDTASLGKSVVTTGYLSYTVKSSDGKIVADEVIAYSVGSIIPTEKTGMNTGAKKVVGTSTGSFLPSSLVEWFALIAIMFILFILGRSIYATYNEEEKKHH